MVEFPHKGAWTIAFVTADTPEDVAQAVGKDDLVTVYVPTTPNPTSGYLIMVPQQDVKPLDMSVEDGLKTVISLGIVTKKKNL